MGSRLFKSEKDTPSAAVTHRSKRVTSASSASFFGGTLVRPGQSIDVVKGDLKTQHVDVIVVSATSEFLCKSICEAGGATVSAAFDAESKKASSNSVISVAAGGQLSCKQVYFLPWKPGSNHSTNQSSLRKFVADAMSRAATDNYQSIAFPAVGCGKLGQPVSFVAETMVEEARRQSSSHGMTVSFVIQPDRTDTYDAFKKQTRSSLSRISVEKTKSVSTKIGSATMEAEEGDITTQTVDVIIASSTPGNLRSVIINAAGSEVQTAFDTEHAKNPHSLLIETPPGNLSCSRIFFLNWQPHTDEEVLEQSFIDLMSTVTQSMKLHKYTSVAFPAIGCGGHGCSVQVVVKTMVREMKSQVKKRNLPWTVRFVIEAAQTNVYNEFCKQVLTTHDDNPQTHSYQIPSTWEKHTGNKKRFVVPSSSSEYQDVLAHFNRTMQGKYKNIVRIERIQNERWYMQYIAHSKDFHDRLKQDTEKRLFHGCLQTSADAIIDDCFNRSYAGVNGIAYGVGVYFSSNASYSHGYAQPNASGERCMFVNRVLIGKTTKGNSSIKVRPLGYDSTTDNNHIFVTYHDAQALAEYLITYK